MAVAKETIGYFVNDLTVCLICYDERRLSKGWEEAEPFHYPARLLGKGPILWCVFCDKEIK